MLKPLTRSFFVTIALLSVFAAPSALGAHDSRHATKRADRHRAQRSAPRHRTGGDARRASQGRKVARRSHHVPKGVPTPPVLPPAPPVNPLPPVSPVQPTPPILPVVPNGPTPPIASFTFTPASPVTGEAITLDGTASSCPDAPCTYEWSDDGGTTRPIPPLWPLGSGSTLAFTFSGAGTKYVRLVVTDAAGQTATIEHNVTISAPLISAPANTAPPTISGTSTEGDMLSATTGAWSNLPLTYTYQWQDCNSSGQSCSSIAGATSSTYTLTKDDVGNTVRVVVVANNLGGTGSASSAATATVAALPVTEPEPEPEPVSPPTNTAMPTVKGTTTEGQKLTTTNGGWTGNPTSYAYQWRHCNSSGKSCTNITGASASSYTLAQSDVGDTMRVTVTASNEGGSGSMSSPTTAKVTASAPAAPTNTTLPTINGTTTEDQQLNATPGTWTGNPTSTTYQWQDCDSSGANCTNITGATASTYTLTTADVGDTVRVVVSVSNAGGSASASSTATAKVTAPTPPVEPTPPPPSEPPPAEPPSKQIGCFSSPGACGYPDPSSGNVGPSAACSSLTPSGALTVSTAGATEQNMNITGKVTIAANNVTLTNDCITVNGKAELGTNAVAISDGKSGTLISHSDIAGATTTTQSVEEALNNNGGSSDTTADHDYIFNCGECVHGTWKLTNSYVTSNATISTDHYEDIYCNDTTFVAEHDVLINPHEQTANLFCDTNDGGGGPADDHITLTESLLAGAGYSVYPQGNSSSVGSSTMNISNNRVARCLTSQVFNKASGGTYCSGGADLNGDYPFGGQYGVDAYIYCPPTSGQVWSNNVWDDSNETIGC
jgi:hypothetical protein